MKLREEMARAMPMTDECRCTINDGTWQSCEFCLQAAGLVAAVVAKRLREAMEGEQDPHVVASRVGAILAESEGA